MGQPGKLKQISPDPVELKRIILETLNNYKTIDSSAQKLHVSFQTLCRYISEHELVKEYKWVEKTE